MASVSRARRTLMASATTSGPMPSPPITASRMFRAATAVPYWSNPVSRQYRGPLPSRSGGRGIRGRAGIRRIPIVRRSLLVGLAEQRLDPGGGHRARDQVALPEPAPHSPEQLELLWPFDPLGDDLD